YYLGNGLKLRWNTVTCSGASAYGLGYMYQNGANVPVEIIGNKVVSAGGYGWYLYYPYGNASNRSKIINNTVLLGASGYYACMLYYPMYTDVINNSFISTQTSTSYYTMYFYTGNSTTYGNNVIKNNVIAATAGCN